MPVYDYKCECGHEIELTVRIADRDEIQVCPRCGQRTLKRQFSPTTAVHCNLEGGQNVIRHAQQLNRKIKKKQKSAGYGPAVDAMQKDTTPQDKSVSEIARDIKEVTTGRKPGAVI